MSIFRKKSAMLLCAICMIGVFTGCQKKEDIDGGMDTGAWNGGTVTHNGIKIYINGPESGHPSGEAIWSTYYDDEENQIDINIDYFAIEGSLQEKMQELEQESVEVGEETLWGNACFYYTEQYEYLSQDEEAIITEALHVFISLNEDNYLELYIRGGFEPLEDALALFDHDDFQQSFTLEME